MKTLTSLVLILSACIPTANAQSALANSRLAAYNSAVAGCGAPTSQACRDAGGEAAADLVQTLIVDSGGSMAALPPIVADPNEGRRLALSLLANRTDGAPASVGGGTSLASLGSVTELISAAMESGAFSKGTSGTVTTLRANVGGAYWLLTGECPAGTRISYPACISADMSALKGLSIAASFDTSRNDQVAPGTAESAALGAQALLFRVQRGLSAINVRYDFYRPRRKDSTLRADWMTGIASLKDSASAYAAAMAAGPGALVSEAQAEMLPALVNDELLQLPPGTRMAKAQQLVAQFLVAPGHQVATAQWVAFQTARKNIQKAGVKFFQDTLSRRLFSLEFTHQRPTDEPEYGNARLVASHRWGSYVDSTTMETLPSWEMTFNIGANFYYSGMGIQKDRRLRDFQTALQFDRKLWKWTFLNQPQFTLAGYYQRLTDNMVLEFNSDAIAPNTGIVLPKPANVILQGTKGDVGIAQAKLTIPIRNGVSFPIAISWSNRTEFLRVPGNDVRGHFGFLFDLEKLFNSLTQ